MDKELILYRLINRDDWEAVDAVDSFIYIFDRMPPRMRLIVDLKMTGEDNKTIAKMLNIAEVTVRLHLRKAKRYIAQALF